VKTLCLRSAKRSAEWREQMPEELRRIVAQGPRAIPAVAKDRRATELIKAFVQSLPTEHYLVWGDARAMDFVPDESVHLIVCSPPYWTLKQYPPDVGQLGRIGDYEAFLDELDKVWRHCYRVLVRGGRLIIVVGDVCIARRHNRGRHLVVPLHASIIERCRRLGFDNLQGIFWCKIANANYEVNNGSRFFGKPYEPNAIIKNDVEYVLMQRKPGGYRKPSLDARFLSLIPVEEHQRWFRLVWDDVPGASRTHHPAPYPIELAERLIRMYSFVGDTVLDPFVGTGTTTLAAARWGRHSIGIEVERRYWELAVRRVRRTFGGLFGQVVVHAHAADAGAGPLQ